jgi:Domain of unknown function (DUF4440)
MPKQEDLLAFEAAFWAGDADFYRKNLAQRCLVAFTEMAGVFDKEEIAATIKGGSRWQDVSIDPKGMLEPANGVAMISYEARAVRESGETYAALVSSTYVQSDGAWKLAFHQQTPLEPADE